MDTSSNIVKEVRDIVVSVIGSLAALSTGSFLSSFFRLGLVWLPQVFLLMYAFLLTKASLLPQSVITIKQLRVGLLIAPAATFTAYIASSLSANVFPPSPELLKTLESLAPRTWLDWLLAIVFSLLVVAPAEEIVFRGVVHSKVAKILPTNIAVVASSTVFAAAHLDLSRFFPTFVIGIFTAYALNRTGSLASPVIIHGFNNAAYFTILFLSSSAFAAEYFGLP